MTLRKWHAYVGLAATLPLLLIVGTGILLLFRGQSDWIQPSTVKLERTGGALLTMEAVVAKFEPGTVEQVIYRPGKHNFAVRIAGGNEVQLHPETGEVVKNLPRRSGFLIDLHQGSWLGGFGQYGLHFAASLSLFFLIISGLFIFPFRRRRKA